MREISNIILNLIDGCDKLSNNIDIIDSLNYYQFRGMDLVPKERYDKLYDEVCKFLNQTAEMIDKEIKKDD